MTARKPAAKSPRRVCPQCGSVAVDVGPKLMHCLNCTHSARRFPRSTDAAPSPEAWDGRPRVGSSGGLQVLKIRGAE